MPNYLISTIFNFQINNDENSEELEIKALDLERKSLLAEYRDLSKKVLIFINIVVLEISKHFSKIMLKKASGLHFLSYLPFIIGKSI